MIYQSNTTYNSIKEKALFNRYISLKQIEPLIHKLPKDLFEISVLGTSVLHQPIHHIKVGNGSIKVLMWSQMHGNESTTTKALFDLFNHIIKDQTILNDLTLSIIPMLSPDGSNAYTRINANKVDLNRDAQNLSQPESKLFKSHYDAFKPDICLNLHGQRTIFNVGVTNKPATLSFLAPAGDKNRLITETRKQSMRLINAINDHLQTFIPNHIGRYDDGFNANCVGDTLTMLNIPTILFEAGHYKDDYEREKVRYLVYEALLSVLDAIKNKVHINGSHLAYEEIPENGKLFCDVIVQNAKHNGEIVDIELQFEEFLENDAVNYMGIVKNITQKSMLFAHKYIDANRNEVFNEKNTPLNENDRLFYVKIGESKILLKTD